MTLHETRENMTKLAIAGSIGLGGILVLVILFRIGVVIKDVLFPPRIEPPNMAYGELAPLQFPQSDVLGDYTYDLNTTTGALPEGLPDRLHVYPIIHEVPGLNNLEEAKVKVRKLDFITAAGAPVLETPLSDVEYQWIEDKGIRRDLKFNIISFDFTLNSEYLTALSVINGNKITTEQAAIETVQAFLGDIASFPEDVDLNKTTTFDDVRHFITTPELLEIVNGALSPASSLSNTDIIRINLYQKDIEYDLDNGLGSKAKITLPILYPKPPHSTMHFLLGSGANELQVVKGDFLHQEINLQPENLGIYPIKTGEEAYQELREGKAYIAAYKGTASQILITNVFLAYYLGDQEQDYLMPIYVFEGKDGFFGYVSAVKPYEAPEDASAGEATEEATNAE
jgi:hypothetical protein